MSDLNHYVIFSEGSWTIEHSNECRMSEDLMAACRYNVAVALVAPGHGDGRWQITVDSQGLPSLVLEEAS